MTADLTAPIYQDEEAARAHLEAQRWPGGPVCPKCGTVDNATRLQGEKHRPGLLECRACRKQFSVTVGTVFERSHVPLHKWVLAVHLITASKKGMSAHQLHRMLRVTYKTAWFMAHRIREAMTDENPAPLGGEGKIIEADETYQGKVEEPEKLTKKGKPTLKGRRAVVALVERGGGVRAVHLPKVTHKNVGEVLAKHADPRSVLYTDESRLYPANGRAFAGHETVRHSAGEYARGPWGPRRIHTNSVEGFFGIFKRGMAGVYHHVGEQHLQRYLNEFAFRYSHRVKLGVDDRQRALLALRGIEGKRLTYRRINAA
ncbi:IS1595 family transposase [Roseicella frigidaeris]|uniref:IS1595 family transposase n=1 Tax=Roseicella frigidaeris TaxID=2230885 RepID=A0A327M8Y0_9PROT|nr:IS1595 family transposase [Roseicella frigidaeris]RAI58744.1 IS1595 family transposase [Roseicella frigidaeris]